MCPDYVTGCDRDVAKLSFEATAWDIRNWLGRKGNNMKKRVLLGLQMFAEEGDGVGAEDGNGGGAEGGNGENGNSSGEEGGNSGKALSFDDFLKEGKNQSEFDRRVTQAIAKATSGLEEKYSVLMSDKVSEAEKLAKMSKEERTNYEAKKKEREFDEKVAAFEKEKLLVVVKDDLQKQSLPIAFGEALVAISDAEKIKEAIVDIKRNWDAEITEAIKSKARQTTPNESGQASAGSVGKTSIAEMAKNNRIIK